MNHDFQPYQSPHRIRDVRWVRCSACGHTLRLPMRTREPTASLIEKALRPENRECVPNIGTETPSE